MQQQQPQGQSAQAHHSLLSGPLGTFAPWIIFWVASGPATWEVACISALIAAVVLLVVQLDTGGSMADHFVALAANDGRPPEPLKLRAPKILDVGTILFFAAFSIVGAFVDRASLIQLEHYAQAISSGALGLIVLVSIVVGHPFTESYAKESTPREVWSSPTFKRTNLVMSTVWFLIFAVSALLGLLAVTSWARSHSLADWFEWYIPIALVVVGFKFNQWYPAQVRARMAAASASASGEAQPAAS